MINIIEPNWKVPDFIRAGTTTRAGGVSLWPYESLNLAHHVGDKPEKVNENRQRLYHQAHFPQPPVWLSQTHSTDVIALTGMPPLTVNADAVYTAQVKQVCSVMTADCLPLLFCSENGEEIAAAHAGWRGLCEGILENTVACFAAAPASIVAWLGPAIGPTQFEVGGEVRDAFIAKEASAAKAFCSYSKTTYLADLYQLARLRLQRLGITKIYGGEYCTVTDKRDFFSYRREATTGRMATFIWRDSSGQ